MSQDSDLIERAGGDDKVAKACGISADALRKWREMGRVPPRHWPTIARLAGLPMDDVAGAKLGAKQSQARRAA